MATLPQAPASGTSAPRHAHPPGGHDVGATAPEDPRRVEEGETSSAELSKTSSLSFPPMPPLERRLSPSHPVIARRRSLVFPIPPLLLKPGMEMTKVSAKRQRRSRRIWLEVGDGNPDGSGQGEVRLCWEKNWRGVGPKREESLPLSDLRDLRFGTEGSPYRTTLQLQEELEPRWMTLIFVKPPSLLSLSNSGSTYKILHFIAPDEARLGMWKAVLEKYREGRGVMGQLVASVLMDLPNPEADPDLHGNEGKVVEVKEVHRLCARLGMGMSKEEIDLAFQEAAAPHPHLDFPAFQNFVKLLKRRVDIEAVFRAASGGAATMSRKDWQTFLRDVQKSALDEEAMDSLYNKYADAGAELVSLEGFTQLLLSSDTSPLKDETGQDMTRPLSEYFISSSHNTYLVGNQLQGESTVEGYIRALQRGCRCVELDVWPGDDGFPVVTHGRTLTSKLTASDAMKAIAKYAFLASTYPVILSLEIHCDTAQQDKLVTIFRETLGDKLLQQRLDGGSGEVDTLPSPQDLKGKVLIKAKNLFITTSGGTQQVAQPVDASSVPAVDLDSSTESSTSSDSDFKRVFNAVRRSFDDRRPGISPPPIAFLSRSPSFGGTPTTPKPVMSAALASLLVYTVGVKARGFNKKETYGTTHVLSFGENRLAKMMKEEVVRQDLVDHNRTHLTRAYPKGIRVTSTNYLPHHLWASGVQMVAINWQTFDLGLALNTAMFARAGRTGYVLKPDILRRRGPDKDKAALARMAKYVLKVEVISAQQLPRSRETESGLMAIDPFVEVGVYVPGSVTPLKRRTKVVTGNAFNPLFRSEFSIPFTTSSEAGMLDLVFLRFEVLNAKGNLKAANEEGKGDFVGAYTTALGSLSEGYRHVPLYDAMGDQHLFTSLFIKTSCVKSEEPIAPTPFKSPSSSSKATLAPPSP